MEETFRQPSGTGEPHGGVGPEIIVENVADLIGALVPANAGRRIRVRKGTDRVEDPLLVPDGASLEGVAARGEVNVELIENNNEVDLDLPPPQASNPRKHGGRRLPVRGGPIHRPLLGRRPEQSARTCPEDDRKRPAREPLHPQRGLRHQEPAHL
jgi:hypothetical protein